MHSFIHSFNPTYSLYHSFTRTNQASPLPFITIIIHQPCIARTTQYGIRTSTHEITMTRTQRNAFVYIPLANHLTKIHKYMYACIEMTTSSHPLNVLLSIFSGGHRGGGGGGGDIDHRVGAATTLMWRVDPWMTDLKAMVMRICGLNAWMHAWTDCCLCVFVYVYVVGGSLDLFAGWSSLHCR